MTGPVRRRFGSGWRQCPLCTGVVPARYWSIVRHLAGAHRPGEIMSWVRGR